MINYIYFSIGIGLQNVDHLKTAVLVWNNPELMLRHLRHDWFTAGCFSSLRFKMASSFWKGVVGIGLFALAHAAFSAAQRKYGMAGLPAVCGCFLSLLNPTIRLTWTLKTAGRAFHASPGANHMLSWLNLTEWSVYNEADVEIALCSKHVILYNVFTVGVQLCE